MSSPKKGVIKTIAIVVINVHPEEGKSEENTFYFCTSLLSFDL